MKPLRTFVALSIALVCSTVALRADDAPPASQPSPVDYHKLKACLPETLAGLKRTHVEGSKMAFGPTVLSNAKADYGGEDGKPSVNVEAVSYGDYEMIKQMSMAFTLTNIDTESDDGFQKTMPVHGHPGLVDYKIKDKSGSITVGAGARILVTVTLNNITADELKAIGEALPLNELEAAAK